MWSMCRWRPRSLGVSRPQRRLAGERHALRLRAVNTFALSLGAYTGELEIGKTLVGFVRPR
jgi:hypothetical protein